MNPRQVVDLTVFESTSCSGITKKRQLPPSIKSLSSGENRSKVLSRADISKSPYQANIANRKFAIDQVVNNRKCVIEIQLSLINTTEFTATAHHGSVSDALIETLKRIPGSRFDWDAQRFTFPVTSHDILLQRCSTHDGCVVKPIPKEILTATQLRNSQVLGKTHFVVEKQLIPNFLISQLALFQLEAIQFSYDKLGRVLIADEMGLGKTRTAIGVACLYTEDWPVLILCPSSAKYHWKNELRKLLCPHLLMSEHIFLCETAAAFDEIDVKNVKFIILSYTIFTKVCTCIKKMSINVVIVDESHYLKSRFAQRTTALIPLLHKSRRVVLLSGTPALSRPLELFTQLNALLPSKFPDFHLFGKRYCQNGNIGSTSASSNSLFTNQHMKFAHFGENKYKGANFTQELHVILTSSVMIRRLKKDVLLNLPAKHRYLLKVNVQKLSKKLEFQKILSSLTNYEELLERKRSVYLDEIKRAVESLDSFHDSPADKKNLLMKLYKDSGKEKLPGAFQHIQEYLRRNPTQKILLFAHHHEVLDQTAAFLRELKLPHIRIDGSTSAESRYSQCEEFQDNFSIRVALLGITAAGIALTLTAASTIFFLELYWTPGVMLQAEDRVHRIGQLQDVKIFYFFAEDTIDELLWPLIRKKMQLLGEFVEGNGDQDLDASIYNTSEWKHGSTITDNKLSREIDFECIWEGDFESAFRSEDEVLDESEDNASENDEYEEYLKRKEPIDKLALKFIQSSEELIFGGQDHSDAVQSTVVVDLSNDSNLFIGENDSVRIGVNMKSKKQRILPNHMARVASQHVSNSILEIEID